MPGRRLAVTFRELYRQVPGAALAGLVAEADPASAARLPAPGSRAGSGGRERIVVKNVLAYRVAGALYR